MKRSQRLRLWRFGFPAMRLTGGKIKSFPLRKINNLRSINGRYRFDSPSICL